MTVGTPTATEARIDGNGSPSLDLAYPTRRDEAWRYAPHRELARLVFGPSPTAPPVGAPDVDARLPAVDGPRVVVVNGVVDLDRSELSRLPDGVELIALAEAAERHPDAIAPHFRHDVPATDAFVELNRRLGRDGAFLRVDADVAVAAPIHLVDITVADAGDAETGDRRNDDAANGDGPQTPNATAAGFVIALGDRASASVVHTHVGAGADFAGSHSRTTVTLGAGSKLTHVLLQDVPATQIQLNRVEVAQAEGSEYHGRSFNLGARYGRVDYQVRLAGPGATAELSGLYFGTGEQTLDQQITVVHDAENCVSRQAFRGVLDDRSTGVFNGGIAVSPGANGTDAEQANDNLLLSTSADINTQPRLEILADEVACAHGATVGQLDDDALYYLRSRGLPADQARKLLIAGFADQAVDEVEIDAVRSWVAERLGFGHGLDGRVEGEHDHA